MERFGSGVGGVLLGELAEETKGRHGFCHLFGAVSFVLGNASELTHFKKLLHPLGCPDISVHHRIRHWSVR